ncbi:MAG: LysR family transcriptional regulator [Hyphomicrobiales bacterium]|nr:LysR family transcriptional regulator [Hyphomicrobiales bacterium]
MDTLKAMQVFVAVARRRGFAAAARDLGLSTSSVSRHVVNLEDLFGVQLFNRSTRHLSLTPTGEEMLSQCQGIVRDVDNLLQTERHTLTEPEGRLRVTMPRFVGTILMEDVIARFAMDFPRVDLDLLTVDRVVNVVEEGFDLAVRVGKLPDSTLVSRKFLDLNLALVASPDYIEQYGRPGKPEDLREHNCIIDSAAPYRDRWPLTTDSTIRRHQVKGNVTVNSGAAARDLVVGGAGLALLPEYLVFDDIEKGRLMTVMDEFAVNYGGVFIVYPRSRHQSRVVRRFVNLLVEHSKPISRHRDRMRARR